MATLNSIPSSDFSVSIQDFSDNLLQLATTATISTSACIDTISESMKKISNALSKINATCFTPDGEYKNFGDIFTEVYEKIDDAPEELKTTVEDSSSYILPRPKTPINIDFSNQNKPFDFLEQNAYDYISVIFDPRDIEFITPIEKNIKFML